MDATYGERDGERTAHSTALRLDDRLILET
jgi:hypothetical protein